MKNMDLYSILPPEFYLSMEVFFAFNIDFAAFHTLPQHSGSGVCLLFHLLPQINLHRNAILKY